MRLTTFVSSMTGNLAPDASVRLIWSIVSASDRFAVDCLAGDRGTDRLKNHIHGRGLWAFELARAPPGTQTVRGTADRAWREAVRSLELHAEGG